MATTERPILFSAPMVRALLAGTKTQTRRIVKWRDVAPGLNLSFTGLSASRIVETWVLESPSRTSREWRCAPTPCPYGKPGDRLWVREAFGFVTHDRDGPRPESLIFRADDNAEWDGKWRPSIHMPRWASRVTLGITDVRVQRLQEISEEDAIAEGIAELVPQPNRGDGVTPAALCLAAAATVEAMPRTTRRAFLAGALAASLGFAASPSRPWEVVPARWTRPPTPQQVYAVLWESINGPGSWAANPWVWSISFRRVTP